MRRFADEYTRVPSPEDFAAVREKVISACERAGRDPARCGLLDYDRCLIGAPAYGTTEGALERGARALRTQQARPHSRSDRSYAAPLLSRLRSTRSCAAARVRARLRRECCSTAARRISAGTPDRARARTRDGPSVGRHRHHRLEASATAFRVAATLLVLEFSVDADLWSRARTRAARAVGPSYFAYVTSASARS